MAEAVSLNQQLVELRTLREEHSLILEKTVARGRLGERERAFRLGRLDAAIATLRWVQRNEDVFKAAVTPEARGAFDPRGAGAIERAQREANPTPPRAGPSGDFDPSGKAEVERGEQLRSLTRRTPS